VLGVPLGIVTGRLLWTLFVHQIDAVPSPSIVAAIPGRMGAPTPTAIVLRAE
jgi:hypothetical protein